MSNEHGTTIAAVSTAYGEGGIGIVRVSGPGAGAILAQVFARGATGHRFFDTANESISVATPVEDGTPFKDRYMHYGRVVDPESGETIDEALCVFMRAPHTYTGEDVAEIQCHGSVASLRRALDAVLACGAEPAGPGQFTRRAFLNGRIDLAQAEAVIDIVRARTDASASAAMRQLEGGLSRKVSAVRGRLLDALAAAAVHIDYPDEDKDYTDPDSIQRRSAAALRPAASELIALIAGADAGMILREGLNVVIAGAANAGKSSLLNALLRDSRAIVTDIPGTTRDSIEEQASVRGIPVRLTDTAGIRETDDEIERIGVERAKAALTGADLTVFLVDGSKEIDEDDIEALREVARTIKKENLILAISKSDLPRLVTDEDIAYLTRDAGLAAPPEKLYTISLSAETGDGIPVLEDLIERAVYGGAAGQGAEPLVTNARHKDLLIKARRETDAAIGQLEATGDLDLAETNLRAAVDYLGEITGETTTDDLLDRIFSRFCIGK
jgi:tRNA modification GTPase